MIESGADSVDNLLLNQLPAPLFSKYGALVRGEDQEAGRELGQLRCQAGQARFFHEVHGEAANDEGIGSSCKGTGGDFLKRFAAGFLPGSFFERIVRERINSFNFAGPHLA